MDLEILPLNIGPVAARPQELVDPAHQRRGADAGLRYSRGWLGQGRPDTHVRRSISEYGPFEPVRRGGDLVGDSLDVQKMPRRDVVRRDIAAVTTAPEGHRRVEARGQAN